MDSENNSWNGQFFRKPDATSENNLKKFQKIIEDKYQIQFNDFWEFHKWTVDHLTEFWSEMWNFSGIIYSRKYNRVIDLDVPMDKSNWFPGAKLNFAENLLKYRDKRIAIITAGEDHRGNEKITYAEMFDEVRLYAAAFKEFGIKKGDVVACYASNRKEALFTMLAVNSIGAVWASALPLLGSQSVLNRFHQVYPKILLTVDRFSHLGQDIEMLTKVKEITEGLSSLQQVIIIASTTESKSKDISEIRNSCFLDDFLKLGKGDDGVIPNLEFEQLPFSHPSFISYTSGTTGNPKAVVHGCGALLSTFRDFAMHLDSTRESVTLNFSSPGWISWLITTSMHFLGMTIVLLEGMPYYLSPTYLWDLVDQFKLTHMYLSSSIIQEFAKRGYVPTKENHLTSLEVLFSCGSVVKPQDYDFMSKKVKKGVLFSSCYACTEFMGSCLIVDRSLPLYIGEINAKGLGVDIQTVNDKGIPVTGEMGELVVVKPMPNLPLGFWADLDGSLYKEKYFSKYPGKFAMSDYAIVNPSTKGTIICCRSDETLKQRGCRFGSSEIYNVLDKFTEVEDSLCVSQYSKSMEERAVLFLKMNKGCTLNEALVNSIRRVIASELTERHIPDVILETEDIPYNINGKKTEVIVKNIINNKPYGGDTIRNPECLRNFVNIPALKGF